jgi:hypothetical protein
MRDSLLSHSLARRLAALAFLSLSGTAAQACEVWRDDEWGVWRSNCSLSEDFRGRFELEHIFVANLERRIILKFPDLHVRKFKFFVIGTSVSIEADIENLGKSSVQASTLAVEATFGNPLNGMQYGSTMTFTAAVPALAAMSSVRVSVGSVNVPNNQQDWDLIMLGVIDPPTSQSPARGVVFESDETNNAHNHACRWYGPMPDTSLQPCN